jgi:lipoprotein-releasing system permease protein
MVGAAALIIILSTFNGFEEVVSRLYNTFDSDLKIVPAKGKYFSIDSITYKRLKGLKGVKAITSVLEENALLKYRQSQTIATFKAIQPEFLKSTGLDTMIFLGDPILKAGPIDYAIVGAGVASRLDLQGYDDVHSISFYVPRKGASAIINPEQAFNSRSIFSNGIFSVQQDFDQRYVLLPLDFAYDLMNDSMHQTAVEIRSFHSENIPEIKEQAESILGSRFKVLDRFEQNPLLYKVMHSEKLAVYLVLTFILLIAAFNLIGALLMLAIEKQNDMAVLTSMGAQPKLLQNIILFEGLLLSFSGGLAGIGIGALICWLQKIYGFVKIGAGTTFVIKSYPVAFNFGDFVLVFITVLVLGFFASYFPARKAMKRTGQMALNSY